MTVLKPLRNLLLSAFAIGALSAGTPAWSQEADEAASVCPPTQLPPERVQALIAEEAKRQGADIKLALAIAEHESAYGAKTNSPAGAKGIMQLMPATADHYGVKDICDDAENIRAGITYLNDLSQLFDGQVMLIAAAYNAGETRVINARGIPSIPETVNYTALVTNTYFGFDSLIGGAQMRARQDKGIAPPQNDQMIVSAGSDDTKPIPINTQPKAATSNTWLGGSVLYVQQ